MRSPMQRKKDEENMIRKNYICLSGGKDSTALLIYCLENDIEFDEVVFSNTGIDFEENVQHVNRISKTLGVKITTIEPERCWDDVFFSRFISGRYEGKMKGWPLFLKSSWCSKYLKNIPLTKYVGRQNNSLIGICSDEPTRIGRDRRRKYPLYENRVTSDDCRIMCEKYDLMNPLYTKYGFNRSGCTMCVKSPQRSDAITFKYFPEILEKIRYYEEKAIENDAYVKYYAKKTPINEYAEHVMNKYGDKI